MSLIKSALLSLSHACYPNKLQAIPLYFLLVFNKIFFLLVLLANILESKVALLWAGEEGLDFSVCRDFAFDLEDLIWRGSLFAHLNIYNNKDLLGRAWGMNTSWKYIKKRWE